MQDIGLSYTALGLNFTPACGAFAACIRAVLYLIFHSLTGRVSLLGNSIQQSPSCCFHTNGDVPRVRGDTRVCSLGGDNYSPTPDLEAKMNAGFIAFLASWQIALFSHI